MRAALGALAIVIIFIIGLAAIPSCYVYNQSIEKPEQAKAEKSPHNECATFGTLFIRKVFDVAEGRDKEITALSTLAIALFTVVLAVAAGLQYCAIMASIREARRGAIIQANLTRRSIDLAREEFISSHRPRLVVYSLNFVGGTPKSDDIEGPIRIGFHYVNAGDSLAKVKQVGTKLVHLKKPTMPPDIIFDVQKVDPPLEIECGRHAFRITVEAFDQEQFIANCAWNDYSSVCVGYIVYSDENGTDRQLGFCRKMDRESDRWSPVDDPQYEYSY